MVTSLQDKVLNIENEVYSKRKQTCTTRPLHALYQP
jgi:hypothetical protein